MNTISHINAPSILSTLTRVIRAPRMLLADCAMLVMLALATPASAGTATCQDGGTLLPASAVTITLSGSTGTIPLGGLTLKGVEPDEIDLACAPQVLIDGLVLQSIDPDEIDFQSNGEAPVDSIGGTLTLTNQTAVGYEYDALGRLTRTTTPAKVKLVPGYGTLREVVDSKRPYVTAVEFDVVFDVVEVIPDSASVFGVYALVLQTSVVPQGQQLQPEIPVCSSCNSH